MEEKIHFILQQVSNLYFKYGIKSVSMDDVSKELGISKKTLYGYFNDKNDLVRQFLSFHIHNIREVFEKEKKEHNAIDHLLFISKIMMDFLKGLSPAVHYDLQKYYPEIFKDLFEYKRDNMLERVKQNIIHGQKEGLYRKDLNPDIISYIYVNRIEASLDADFLRKFEFSSTELYCEMLNYHIRGISSKKGLEYFEKQICLNKYLTNEKQIF